MLRNAAETIIRGLNAQVGQDFTPLLGIFSAQRVTNENDLREIVFDASKSMTIRVMQNLKFGSPMLKGFYLW